MVSIIYDKFEMNISNKIVSYMMHPTAETMSEYLDLQDLLCFDTDHSWFDWNKIRHYEHHSGIRYFTIHDDSEGCSGSVRRWGSWWVWKKRVWLGEICYLKIPNKLQVIYKFGDQYEEYVKLELLSYKVKKGELYFTYPDDPENDDDDDDDADRCDCCNEYWHDCLCICSDCHGDYRVCLYSCYDT